MNIYLLRITAYVEKYYPESAGETMLYFQILKEKQSY